MPTCVTPSSSSQARRASSSRVEVPNERTSLRGLHPGGPSRTHAQTAARGSVDGAAGDDRGRVDVEPGAALDGGFHDRLHRWRVEAIAAPRVEDRDCPARWPGGGPRPSGVPGRGAGRSYMRDHITWLMPDLDAIADGQDRSDRHP